MVSLTSTDEHSERLHIHSNDQHKSYLAIGVHTTTIINDRNETCNAYNSPMYTIFLLLTTMISTGLIVQSYVFKETGILMTLFEYVVVNYLLYIGMELLVMSSTRVEVFDYADLAFVAFGNIGSLSVDLAIVLANSGVILTNLLFIGQLIENLGSIYVSVEYSWLVQSRIVICIISVVVLYPLCLMRRFGDLAGVAAFNVVAIVSVILLVILIGPTKAQSHSHNDLLWCSLNGAFKTSGKVIFHFYYTMCIFHSYKSLNPSYQDNKSFMTIHIWTIIFGIIITSSVGLVGYLCFRSKTEINILDNFSSSLVGDILKFIFSIYLMFYIPSCFVVLRHSFTNLCNIKMEFVSSRSLSFFTAIALMFYIGVVFLFQVCILCILCIL